MSAVEVDSWVIQTEDLTQTMMEALPWSFLGENFIIGLGKGIYANAIITLYAFIYSNYEHICIEYLIYIRY